MPSDVSPVAEQGGPPNLHKRSSGLLLHLSSLPGPHGCGDLGPAADRFARWLTLAGLRWWQMLPVGPVGYGNSPYSSSSAFAGNPLFISTELLELQGLLSPAPEPKLPLRWVDYEQTAAWRNQRLQEAFERWMDRGRVPCAGGGAAEASRAAFHTFCTEQASWLEDFALYSALKDAHGGTSWTSWEPDLRDRDPAALADARDRLSLDIERHRFQQWLFDEQWERLRQSCASLGVGLIGDLPIFVAHDSADVWTHRELFQLDADGEPTVVAGVPPDYFSPTGQRWGNPHYRWDVLRSRGYRWWIERLRQMLHRFDAMRLDHFIGFVRAWEIPADCPTAERGSWRSGPGADFFSAATAALGRLPVIAEDLGLVTPEVIGLRDALDFPGIRILQFAFGTDPQGPSFRPHNYPRHTAVYTGTHDNDTVEGWFAHLATSTADAQREERALAIQYLGACLQDSEGPSGGPRLDPTTIHGAMVRAALASVADLAILPLQDVLGLGSEARMNSPGTLNGNWKWRVQEGELDDRLAVQLRELIRIYERGRSRANSAASDTNIEVG